MEKPTLPDMRNMPREMHATVHQHYRESLLEWRIATLERDVAALRRAAGFPAHEPEATPPAEPRRFHNPLTTD